MYTANTFFEGSDYLYFSDVLYYEINIKIIVINGRINIKINLFYSPKMCQVNWYNICWCRKNVAAFIGIQQRVILVYSCKNWRFSCLLNTLMTSRKTTVPLPFSDSCCYSQVITLTPWIRYLIIHMTKCNNCLYSIILLNYEYIVCV